MNDKCKYIKYYIEKKYIYNKYKYLKYFVKKPKTKYKKQLNK